MQPKGCSACFGPQARIAASSPLFSSCCERKYKNKAKQGKITERYRWRSDYTAVAEGTSSQK